jgi:hypothetical protein
VDTFVVVAIVFVVHMTVVDVVDVAAMDDGGVAAAGSVGVTVRLSGRVAKIGTHNVSYLVQRV